MRRRRRRSPCRFLRAWCLRAALLKHPAYQEYPGLVEAMGLLEAAKFAKMIAFLKCPVRRRVRTNNHVERVNRKLRYEEKARYKWRKRRTTVRFLVLLLDRYWRQERAIRNRWQPVPTPARSPGGHGSTRDPIGNAFPHRSPPDRIA